MHLQTVKLVFLQIVVLSRTTSQFSVVLMKSLSTPHTSKDVLLKELENKKTKILEKLHGPSLKVYLLVRKFIRKLKAVKLGKMFFNN